MSTSALVGGPPSYDLSEDGDTTGTSLTDAPLGTPEEPFTHTFERVVVRMATQQELDDFLAWLSNMQGKPLNQLRDTDFLQRVPPFDLRDSMRTGHDRSLTSFALRQGGTDRVTAFNESEFFGDRIPQFTPGTGSFNGAPLDLPVGIGMDATTAGFAATAQALYAGNYSENPGTPLNTTELAQLNPDVRALMENMFGSETPFSLEHLNVLKMMSLVTGQADQPPSTWTVTPTQGRQLLEASTEESDTFVGAISLLNLRIDDISLADGVRAYFDEAGNFIQGFGTGNVEEVAGQLVDTMSPPETAMPGDITQGENVSAMLNSLLGLDPANTTFTVEQINAAIAMGLLGYDASGRTVNLTTNGQGYLTTKRTENATPATPPPPPAPMTADERTDAFLAELVNMDGSGNVYAIFDVGDYGHDHDGKISRKDIETLANKDPHNNGHWNESGFRNMSIETRVRVVALARYAVEHNIFGHLESQGGPGQRYDNVFDGRFITGSIDQFVAALPADRPNFAFRDVENGYNDTAAVVELRGESVLNPP